MRCSIATSATWPRLHARSAGRARPSVGAGARGDAVPQSTACSGTTAPAATATSTCAQALRSPTSRAACRCSCRCGPAPRLRGRPRRCGPSCRCSSTTTGSRAASRAGRTAPSTTTRPAGRTRTGSPSRASAATATETTPTASRASGSASSPRSSSATGASSSATTSSSRAARPPAATRRRTGSAGRTASTPRSTRNCRAHDVARAARAGTRADVPAAEWFRNAIVYSLSVEAFMDSDGDGIGDFAGLRRRLDHLESLGVDVIWLAPSQPTPNRDDGYDIVDHYGIDSRLGSSGDFVQFVEEAAGRGIRVLLDLVVNHTSDRNPWFLEAQRDASSRYRDWYIWSEKRPADATAGVVFPGVQRTTWTYSKAARAWYFHRFYDFEPDLNTDNPLVREEIHRIIDYWLQLGAAGFRVDAVPFLLEKPGDRAPHFESLRELRDVLQWK